MDTNSTLRLRTGRSMPVIGLGTWQLTNNTAGAVEEALRLGYRMIDTSSDYGTQPGIGEAINRSGIARDEIYLVAKVEQDDRAFEATRKYLGEMDREYADLMLIHRPPPGGAGRRLWEDLIKARDEGLTRDIGVSNYSAAQIDDLVDATGETPAVNQIEWSPFGWDVEMLDYCRERDIVIQAYSPLTRATRLDDQRLAGMAALYDKTPAQVLVRWDLQLGVAPLPKANQKRHQEENINVFDFKIREEHMAALGAFNERYSALGSLPYV